jgi:hypothetical protein
MKRSLTRPLPAWSVVPLVLGTTLVGIVASAGGDLIGQSHGVRYVVETGPGVNADSIGGVTAKCPRRTVVVGGGFAENGTTIDMRMVSSKPVDRGDGDSAPDDGWAVEMYNEPGASSTNFPNAYAVCLER